MRSLLKRRTKRTTCECGSTKFYRDLHQTVRCGQCQRPREDFRAKVEGKT